MTESINDRARVWLNREQKRVMNALLNAAERNAPPQDIDNLTNKLEVLDWLIGLAIKEEEDENA